MKYLLPALLVACTSTTYESREWARTGLEQAKQECYMAIQKNDDISITTCLKAKGWYPK